MTARLGWLAYNLHETLHAQALPTRVTHLSSTLSLEQKQLQKQHGVGYTAP